MWELATHGLEEEPLSVWSGLEHSTANLANSTASLVNSSNNIIEQTNTDNRREPHRCGSCDYSTVSKQNLNLHIARMHAKDTLFRCEYCDYFAYVKYNLNTHRKKVHPEVKPFKCELCDFSAYSKTGLNRHIRVAHSNDDYYKCPSCEYSAANEFTLKVHVARRHTIGKPFVCDYCDKYSSAVERDVTVHIERVHWTTRKCNLCDFFTSDRHAFKIHAKVVHAKEKLHKCPYCDYTTRFKCNLLNNHMKKVHSNDDKPYSCKVKSSLPIHRKTHNTNNIQCPYCDYTTRFKCNLVNFHMKKVHPKEKLLPSQALKIRGVGEGVAIKINTKNKRFKCEFCDYHTALKCNLKTHVKRIHTKTNVFECYYCGHVCGSDPELTAHVKDEHTFKCYYCDHICGSDFELSAHVTEIHVIKPEPPATEEKPLECDDFSKEVAATEIPDLSAHVKDEHTFKCEYCDHVCGSDRDLGAHVTEIHVIKHGPSALADKSSKCNNFEEGTTCNTDTAADTATDTATDRQPIINGVQDTSQASPLLIENWCSTLKPVGHESEEPSNIQHAEVIVIGKP